MERRPLLGREHEVAELAAALDVVAGGGSQTLQVLGEPGIGKSRLLAELCDMAEDRDLLVLAGRVGEFETELPFGVLLNALDDYLSSLDRDRLVALDQRLPELASVFPAFAGVAAGRAGPLHAERYRTYRAVRALLEELARPGPVVLVLDDLHWSDRASAELVAHLSAHPPVGGVLVALAFRPAQTDAQLGATLAAVAREPGCRRLELGPLSLEQARCLLAAGAAGVEDHLYRESGGNPFYLEQLARGAGALDISPGDAPGSTDAIVPEAVRAALAGELASLSHGARAVLQGASVVGDPFDADLAARASDKNWEELTETLDELAARELIREHETPRHYRFRHPIVRRAVYDSSGPGWRLAAHARAAAALKERGAAPRMEAHHVERSARLGDEEAISLLVEAASAAEAAAPLTAAGWFRAAVHLVPGGPAHDDRRLELMVRMAVALGTAGRSGESHAVLEDALARLPSDHPGRTSVVAFCAGLDFYLGRLDQGRGRLLAELDRLGDEPSLDRARIQVELAIGATFTSGDQELHDQALAALETCRAMREPLLTMAAAGILAHAEITLGRFQAAGPLLDEAEAAYAALDDHQLAERIDAMHWLATPAMELARFEDTVRFCERALVISRAAGRGHWLVPLMHEQAFALIGLGRLRDAREVAQTGVEVARLGGQVPALVVILFELCTVATLLGDHDEALRAGEEAVAAAQTFPPSILLGMAGEALARALVEAGEPARAQRELLEAGGGPTLPRVPTVMRARSYETLTRAELAMGRPREAAAWADRAAALTADEELPLDRAAANRARALVELASGSPVEAATLALGAADAAMTVGAVLEAALARALAGRALAQAQQPERAVALLETAEEVFANAGAESYRKRATAELRRLGRKRAPSATRMPGGLGSLTAREREIATLVGKGTTNREIARACFLSEKTVETHLSHIFTKLGVSNRAAVAAAVDQLAAPPP